ncbi:tryptophan synthase subunit beta [Corynebacterium heidelbergense]|uniref:Tryptophan synthase beta chain n=1 Tax=Corynebacterium heidelbergense TaxID=2055947 RepID=A0A364VA74_9CORY|nr:tryptophan synthase subunit beta [Corynebacterium heidelbergense]RAV33552.1 tryptophan synthase subunit beta [Corynebacterium heidelbergense]WCZ36418.1 Tryptophan synthase beta chain [Corynebacterium heidelbergense]
MQREQPSTQSPAGSLPTVAEVIGNPSTYHQPDERGHWGDFGGRYIPEALMAVVEEISDSWAKAKADPDYLAELDHLHRTYSGRPSPLYYAGRFSADIGAKVYLKREDLNHTGSHKINNVLGQVLLAKRMGKRHVIAETGAGQHGVATATACALLDLSCRIYMGEVDANRQALNIARMRLLGAEVEVVTVGSRTLKDAINEAMRYWVSHADDTYYCFGTAAGPHPFPEMVRDLQRIIGAEAREQILQAEGRLPDAAIACVGGGSNAIGLFHPFLQDEQVRLIGAEAGGTGVDSGKHAAPITVGSRGVFQGAYSDLMQNEDGQIIESHSISAGLDYPGVGPEHSALHEAGRTEYVAITDSEAMEGFKIMCEKEGIIPAIESSHAIAAAIKFAAVQREANGDTEKAPLLLINMSGRGDKDVNTAAQWFGLPDKNTVVTPENDEVTSTEAEEQEK